MRWKPSPHCDARPEGAAVDLVVLHAISLPPGCFEPECVADFFCGRLDCASHPALAALADVRVSAHFVVDREGVITQFVSVGMRAWHAGVSSWEGRERCNDYAIGIEMIGDEKRPFTDAQYRECARLCRALMRRFPDIGPNRIVGHSDVAPGRKWDPGPQWDWTRFRRSLARIRRDDLEVR
jgi:AmpD protein